MTTLYDPHDWRSHLFDVRGSMIVEIAARVTMCVLWSTAVTALHRHVMPLGISSVPHALLGTALGLLLVFRTNASYDRFWEGRKLWGSIVNESRNLARAASVLLASDPARARRVHGWIIAFAYATAGRLQNQATLGPVAGELPEDEQRAALEGPHVPLAVARRLTQELNAARRAGLIDDYLYASLDQVVLLLIDYLGGCERIRNTPMPFAYMVHLRRALIVYTFTLPLALVDAFGWLTVPVTLVVAYILFGIEEIGVEIEDPFGSDENDIPLAQLCAVIERDVRQMSDAVGAHDRAAQ